MQSRYNRRMFGLTLFLLLLSLSSCLAAAPRNVIMLIGDGMGVGVISAARCADADNKLAMDTMPVTGLVYNHPEGALVTDSAAAATALAAGITMPNGTISVDHEQKPVRTILETAQKMGKTTGVISTKFVTDATPAAFVAHARERSMKTEIADQMVNSRIDVILGGGRAYFTPKSSGGWLSDGDDLIAQAKKLGFAVFSTGHEMRTSKASRALGLFAPESMAGDASEPTLNEMTSWAISTLARNGKGFFLMSEGAKIDVTAGDNDADGTLRETAEFDRAVQTALDFARRDGNTLVVVTADHDTGGMAVVNTDKPDAKVAAKWVHGGHTGNMIPVYAFGPGAEKFTGSHRNTDIPRIIAGLWNQKLN